jgi:hypothetical protein
MAVERQEDPSKYGPEAVDLWLQGRDRWNAWADEHPEAVVEFSGSDFAKHRSKDSRWPFAGYRFPAQGRVSFHRLSFGRDDVSFHGAQFGSKGVFFTGLSFCRNVSFAGATFRGGPVIFNNLTFCSSDINRNDAVSFEKTDFGASSVSFKGVTFGISSGVSFKNATFGDADVSFEDATFDCREISFKDARFGGGNVNFNRAAIKAELFDFRGVRCGKSNFDFQDAAFSGRADFSNLRDVAKVEALNFRFCKFDGAFGLAASEPFNCVPDFVGTKTSHHFSLEGVECEFASTKSRWLLWNRLKAYFVDERSRRLLDAERFRRLKELATDNRDFKKALDFNAEEIRASRWRSASWVWKLLPEFVFWFGSDYGRSIWRAGNGLIGLWLLCALLYFGQSEGLWWRDSGATMVDALALSFSQMYGYLPGNRVFRQEMMTSLFGDNSSTGLFWLANAQSVLTIIGTFLLGLSLRNRFKM